METYRLKNIAILILLLLNGFLLLLLGYQYLQARRAETDTAGQLQALEERLGVGFAVDYVAGGNAQLRREGAGIVGVQAVEE